MADDRFLRRALHKEKTSLGEVDVPVLYRELTAFNALFPVDYALAHELLVKTPLEPVRFATGSALAVLAFYDYRDCTLGPYREVGLAIAATPLTAPRPLLPAVQVLRSPAHSTISYWIVDLPVTTALADVAGRELGGFPKFVAMIDVEADADRFTGRVREPRSDEPILTLEGTLGTTLPLPAEGQAVFTQRDETLLRSTFEQKGTMRVGFGRGLTVKVGDVSHPMAEHLRLLRLGGAHPLAFQYGAKLRGVLDVPHAPRHAMAA